MNRGRTSVAFPEKAYLFETTTKEHIGEEPPRDKTFLSEQSQKKLMGGNKLPPSEKALILRNREGGPPFLSKPFD